MVAQDGTLACPLADRTRLVLEAGRASTEPWDSRGGCRHMIVELLYFDLDAERFQELQILVVDFKFRVRGKSGNERRFVGRLFSLLAHSDGGFEDQKNIVAAFFDAGDDFGDLLGIRERFVDG